MAGRYFLLGPHLCFMPLRGPDPDKPQRKRSLPAPCRGGGGALSPLCVFEVRAVARQGSDLSEDGWELHPGDGYTGLVSALCGFAWIFKKGTETLCFVRRCHFFVGTGLFGYSQTGYLLAVATHFLAHRVAITQPEGIHRRVCSPP